MRKKTMALVSSCAAIAVCSSLIVGSTYALFTSESKVDITVKSGKVDVVATVGNLTENLYEGTAILSNEDKTLTVENMVPMDSVSFDIKVVNNSTVTVNYRTVLCVSSDDGLFDGLEVTFNDEEANYTGEKITSNVNTLAVGENPEDITVTISLPEEAGNEYQGKTCKITYAVEAVQGNGDFANVHYATNTEEAQALLDNAEEGDTVVLKAGEYDKLWLRQSVKSVEVEEGYTQWAHTYVKRSIKNLTITGEEGAIVDGISLGSTLYQNTAINPATGEPTKANCYYASYHVENVNFENLTLKSGIAMDLGGWTSDNYIKNITVSNCKSFGEYSDAELKCKFVDIRGTANPENGAASNVKVLNCEIKNRFQGVYFQYINNVTVAENKFDNMTHNSIAIQTGCLGNIVIKDNTIANDHDRAIRFDTFNEGIINIIGNTMTDSGDAKGELCKATSIGEGVTVVFENNDWCGREIKDVVIGFGDKI